MAENENKQENVVVEDFKRTNAKKSKKKFRHRQQNPVLAFYEDNKQYLLLFGVIVVALAAILASILALKIPVVPVCLIIVLEAGIAVCLHDVPIWLHGRAGTDHSWCDLRKTGFYGVMRTGLCSWNFIFKIYQRVENRRLLHSGNNFPAAVFF